MTDPSTEFDLSSCQAFADVPEQALGLLQERCSVRRFHAGEVLIRQGDEGDSLLILVEGSASAIAHTEDGLSSHVGDFSDYDVLGEMALITGEPRTAEVIAESAGVALTLAVADFHEIVMQFPDLAVVLTHTITERLGEQSADGMGGKRVGDFLIKRCVGRGGMAVVYEAIDGGGRRVALKMMSHSLVYRKGGLARFEREADLLAGLEHDNVAGVYGRFPAYKTCFMALEFCDGCDLLDLIKRGYRPSDGDVRRILGQLAAGLHYLHGKDVMHRDLKPQNVLVSRDGRVQLTDFGVARSFDDMPGEALTVPGSIVGTPMYMAPAQILGAPANAASDLYSLGCVLLCLVTGEPPFAGSHVMDVVEKKRGFKLPSRRKVGHKVSRDVYRCLKTLLEVDEARRELDLARLAKWSERVEIPAEYFPET